MAGLVLTHPLGQAATGPEATRFRVAWQAGASIHLLRRAREGKDHIAEAQATSRPTLLDHPVRIPRASAMVADAPATRGYPATPMAGPS
jgi:hypothetical protein